MYFIVVHLLTLLPGAIPRISNPYNDVLMSRDLEKRETSLKGRDMVSRSHVPCYATGEVQLVVGEQTPTTGDDNSSSPDSSTASEGSSVGRDSSGDDRTPRAANVQQQRVNNLAACPNFLEPERSTLKWGVCSTDMPGEFGTEYPTEDVDRRSETTSRQLLGADSHSPSQPETLNGSSHPRNQRSRTYSFAEGDDRISTPQPIPRIPERGRVGALWEIEGLSHGATLNSRPAATLSSTLERTALTHSSSSHSFIWVGSGPASPVAGGLGGPRVALTSPHDGTLMSNRINDRVTIPEVPGSTVSILCPEEQLKATRSLGKFDSPSNSHSFPRTSKDPTESVSSGSTQLPTSSPMSRNIPKPTDVPTKASSAKVSGTLDRASDAARIAATRAVSKGRHRGSKRFV